MIFTLFSFNATAVLKTIENLGVCHVKLSEQYTKKLEAEFKTLSFPYRAEAVSMFSMTTVLHILPVMNHHVVKHHLSQSYFS